jgi:hypothetical protein
VNCRPSAPRSATTRYQQEPNGELPPGKSEPAGSRASGAVPSSGQSAYRLFFHGLVLLWLLVHPITSRNSRGDCAPPRPDEVIGVAARSPVAKAEPLRGEPHSSTRLLRKNSTRSGTGRIPRRTSAVRSASSGGAQRAR